MTSTAIAADVLALSAQLACVIGVAGLLSLVLRIDRAGWRYQYWRGVLLLCALLPWLQGRQLSPDHAVETTVTRALPLGAPIWVSSVDVVAPVAGLLASAHALRDVYRTLRSDGATRAAAGRMLGFAEMNAFLGLDELYRREAAWRGGR